MRIFFRLAVYLLIGASLACGNSSTPTAPTPVAPPVVVAPPPPPPPPAPTITNYAGTWRGNYTVEQCSGSSGSMGDVLCSEARPGNSGGIFKPGVSLPLTIELSQNGTAVNGTLSLGSIRGPVNGSVINNRSLVLSGTVVYNDASVGLTVTNVISNWDTVLAEGGFLVGTFSFNVRVNVYPGDGVVRVRLSNVRR